jgi:biotin carboxylase
MKEEKKILILGGGIMQIPSIKIAKRRGWKVTVADANPDAPGIPCTDRFEELDLKDCEGISRLAAALKRSEGLDGVFTAGTDFSATVAWVAEENGLPGIPYEVALDASDKARMRRCFEKYAIPSPRFVTCTSTEDADCACRQLEFPLVVKPVDNMGARGISKVYGPEELQQTLQTALSYSRSHTAVIEEFIEGPEYSIDAVVYHGKVTVCGFADRHIHFPPYFVELGHTIPSAERPETVSSIIRVFTRAVHALGITEGAAKGDMKLTRNGPVVGEIAARLSGGYMSGWTFPYSSGLEVTGAALNIAVGLPPGHLRPSRDWVSAERAFISIPGCVRSIEGTHTAEAIPEVKDIFLLHAEGEEMSFPRNNVEKCGNVITVASTRESAVEAAREACSTIVVRLQPHNRNTADFLFSDGFHWAPDAYTLSEAENIQAVQCMQQIDLAALRRDPGAVTICDIPSPKRERAYDWHGRSFAEARRLIEQYSGLRFYQNPGQPCLGRLFWRAFLRGGVQGALWLIETLCEIQQNDTFLEKQLISWSG